MENTYNDLYGNKGPAKRVDDPVLGNLLKTEVYSIQRVPGDGSCFFYTIAMILLGYTEEYTKEESNYFVRSSVDSLRSITAHTIYQNPEVLQLQMIKDIDDTKNPNKKKLTEEQLLTEVGKMKKRDGRPDPRVYFDYFTVGENLPDAEQPEISVVQRLPMFSQTLMVIYNSRGGGKPYDFVCNMHIPDIVNDIVLIRRSHDSHYEPIVFYIDGRWEHRLSIKRRVDPDFTRLFRALYDQCPEVREKITF